MLNLYYVKFLINFSYMCPSFKETRPSLKFYTLYRSFFNMCSREAREYYNVAALADEEREKDSEDDIEEESDEDLQEESEDNSDNNAEG